MGLGKTIQAIAFMLHLLGESHGHHDRTEYDELSRSPPVLVVVPLSIVRNWSEELTRFAPTLRQLLFVGDRDARHERKQEFRASRVCRSNDDDPRVQTETDRTQPDVVVTTYEMCIKEADFFQSQRWSMMVVDEAQR